MSQLARLKLDNCETLDDYCIRAQSFMSRLEDAGEQLSATLFNAMVLNGLPEHYEAFVIQESFNPTDSFAVLRTRMRAYSDSKRERVNESSECVALNSTSTFKKKYKCHCCGMPGHFKRECPQLEAAVCSRCNKHGHVELACRSDGSEVQAVSMATYRKVSGADDKSDRMVMDSGSTDHAIKDKSRFVRYKESNNVSMGCPNGQTTRVCGVGDVAITIKDEQGFDVSIVLHDVLHVPEYDVNLLSVTRATQRGVHF